MFQSEVDGRLVDWGLLVKDVMPEHHHDLDYLISMLDWDANVNPEFAKSNKRHPLPVRPVKETEDAGYREVVDHLWQRLLLREGTYGAAGPQRDHQRRGAYGSILTQGHGTARQQTPVSTPSMIRFGRLTEDELFVTAAAAKEGVRIENPSKTDPLVILKHFGPGNPDAE